jgi:plasmid maintenance system antidote protein VapI
MGVVGYEKRIEIVKRRLLEDKTHEKIAEACGVHRVTITKLVSASHI